MYQRLELYSALLRPGYESPNQDILLVHAWPIQNHPLAGPPGTEFDAPQYHLIV